MPRLHTGGFSTFVAKDLRRPVNGTGTRGAFSLGFSLADLKKHLYLRANITGAASPAPPGEPDTIQRPKPMYKVLTACPLFRGLPAEKIEELLAEKQYSVNRYREGEIIARRDTAYSGLMIVLEGTVRGQAPDVSGHPLRIDNIAAPQLIAPAFLFGGYNRLPIDVIADGDVTILTLHRGLIFELMQENIIIMSNFIDIISNRANLLSRKMYFLSFRSVREKLMHYLLEHTTERMREADVSDLNELSECFNAPRSAIVSVLEDLHKHGIVRYEAGRATVLNREALR